MLKAIVFDLDGVLVDADRWHFEALNIALTLNGANPISWQEHLAIYKGIPTKKKLEKLTERRGLSPDLYFQINQNKQTLTRELIAVHCTPDEEKIEMLRLLKNKYKIFVCSNAMDSTVKKMLENSGLRPYVDGFLSNESVKNSKPDPEIYLRAFKILGVAPTECLIVEDSEVGYQAALASDAFICKVTGPDEVNYYRVLKAIKSSEAVNIVIPAAGQGKRFAEKGYVHPKPLIDVNGKPMLQWVLDNFHGVGDITLLMQREHIGKYCVKDMFDANVLPVEGITEGAACTVLLAKDVINNNNELIIANSDQYINFENYWIKTFIEHMRGKKADGGVLVFYSDDPKWSYVKYDENSILTEVAEKKVISNDATVGIYYYRYGKDFVKYAEQMIYKNIRTNNEFYVCPIFNEFIADNKKIYSYTITTNVVHGLGTPEDLEKFLCMT